MNDYSRIAELYSKVSSLSGVIGILGWDANTMMPTASSKYRGEEIALLGRIANKILSSNKLGQLLLTVDHSKCNEWEESNIRLIKRSRDDVLAIDPDVLENLTKASIECESKWREARKNNDFKSIIPYFSKVVDLVREVAKSRAEYFHCSHYDALIGIYDPGKKTAEIEQIVDSIKEFLPEFIQKVVAKQKSWKINEFGSDTFPAEKQKALAIECMKAVGFDFDRGRLDTSVHPFCGGGTQDTRITTRYDEKDFLSGLMGIMHETGHALYEQNLPIKYYNQAVGQNLGMSVHESQSLFLEIQVSRSKEFLEYVLPKVFKTFGVSGPKYSVDNLYKILNKVEPSFIRVDSDEVTYLAHVIMRFELEKEIISGNLKVQDLPGAWNEKMKQYLGITPKTDSEGCMQDIHWYSGTFGYFPTYMLGTMLASQFFTAMTKDVENVHENIKVGKFKPITEWLKKNIHSQGSLYPSSDLVKKVTKSNLDVDAYKEYLTKKFL